MVHLSKDGKKEFLGYRCGFCGTKLYDDPEEETLINIKCGENNLIVRANPEAIKSLKLWQERGAMYWLKLCPACGSFVGVQVVEHWK